MNNKVILAFSGGLDTSYCAVYLSKILNLEVHAVTVNTGGFSASEINEIERHAMSLGVASFHHINETQHYYDTVVKYLLFGNVLKNNTYPLSVSAERIAQAAAIATYAKENNIRKIAHGSTGAGNDQVRFDMIFSILHPTAEILTPIRDRQLSRSEEITFLKAHGAAMNFEKAAYSVNKGLWGTSVGGKETLTSNLPLPESAWPTPISKFDEEVVDLEFVKGEIQGINREVFAHPSYAIQYLQSISQPFGIGRDVHVGDTIIGSKGRVGFEAASPLILIKAHHLLEKHILTKSQLNWKDQLSTWYGNSLHEGQFLEPVMRNIEIFLENTQQFVSGTVRVRLFPHRFVLDGIESPYDLMSPKFGSYGEQSSYWSGEDVKGFTKIFGNQVSMYYRIHEELL
jgi:argininosuccinate synthase